jgi:hypothetical protein
MLEKIIGRQRDFFGNKKMQEPASGISKDLIEIDPITDGDERFMAIYAQCKSFTMTSKERMYALYKAVEYVVKAKMPGDFVECGVWKGGSAMVMAHTLLALDIRDRKIYLYDTFSGMSEPENVDVNIRDRSAKELMEEDRGKTSNVWACSPEEEVRKNIFSTGYKKENMVFIRGKVEDTIPAFIPEKIALLRLDTDWYASTKHELIHLYPRLAPAGVLLIDDYGHWAGAKKAVDEYFFDKPILLNRIDYTGRIGIKIAD